MAKRVRIEVVPRPLPPNWAITLDGSEICRRWTQATAVAAARVIGRAIQRGRAELVVKERDGTISSVKDTYGKDPRPPTGSRG